MRELSDVCRGERAAPCEHAQARRGRLLRTTVPIKGKKMDKNQYTSEEVIFDNTVFDVVLEEIQAIDDQQSIRIEVNKGLQSALDEMERLSDAMEQTEADALIQQCKTVVMETITGQFGLASLFIDAKDGGNVTTDRNFEEGITANPEDAAKHHRMQENRNRDWSEVRREGGYDAPLPAKRKEACKSQDMIIDAYTGKELPKDELAHLDHVVSASEIEKSARNNLFLSPEERAKMATSDINLAWTEASANQSKGESPMDEWLRRDDKATGKTKAEKYDIDEERARKKDREARKHMRKTIDKAAFKKYSKELLSTGGKDAARIAAFQALGVVLREFVKETFIAIKQAFANRGKESLSDIFRRFKERISAAVEKLKKTWKDILLDSFEGGLTAFFSNLLVFVINLFATTLKKMVQMIRAGFVSLVQAVKIIANPPAGMSADEARYQAVKIMTAGLIGAASLGLSAAIEKFLQAIPGLQPLMMFPIPSLGGETRTVSDALAVTLSALLGGLLTTIALYLMDKFRGQGRRDCLQIQLVYQSGLVVEYSTVQTWIVLGDAYRHLAETTNETLMVLRDAEQRTKEAVSQATESGDELSRTIEKLKRKVEARNE